MGLFSRVRDPVRGTAQVNSASMHRGRGNWQTCRMTLVVQAEDVPPFSADEQRLGSDRVGKLERPAKPESGALSDEEFEAEKARLLARHLTLFIRRTRDVHAVIAGGRFTRPEAPRGKRDQPARGRTGETGFPP